MRRKTKFVISAVGIVVLLTTLGTTTMSASTQFVSPTTLESGDFGGDWVRLEGVVDELETDQNTLRFEVTDQNTSVRVVYEGTIPEAMNEGRIVVAKGVVKEDHLVADQLSVRAHEGSENEN
ncbi:cytochrome c-type biogenesis protein CcmE [Halogranum amylolyticum]|uniref:Cytochrome c-type biogenesis protein CcmE n=1 Tax=Halogranum amylolyticum TaxID=660520 RepID=A0A1H8NK53_9EURY|nr:cytochrome c maturation protein CcmE [Halogranum amylolyticum]SEO29994.1 cytochrome c-type biogenesis protein CcmE [Halogranum amylolyticum]